MDNNLEVIIQRIKSIISGYDDKGSFSISKDDFRFIPFDLYMLALQSLIQNENKLIQSEDVELTYVDASSTFQNVRNYLLTLGKEYVDKFDMKIAQNKIILSTELKYSSANGDNISVRAQENVMDGYTVIHEFFHIVQNEIWELDMNPKYQKKHFCEVAPIVAELGYVDYIKNCGFNNEDINLCRAFRIKNLVSDLTKAALIKYLYVQIENNRPMTVEQVLTMLKCNGLDDVFIKKCVSELSSGDDFINSYVGNTYLLDTIIAIMISENYDMLEGIEMSKKVIDYDSYKEFISPYVEPFKTNVGDYLLNHFLKEQSKKI